MKTFYQAGTIIVTICCGFLLTACGGGGSGSDGGGVPYGYTGVQTQATVNSGNAEAIALAAYDSGTVSNLPGAVPMSVSESPTRPRPLAFAQALQQAAQSMDLYPGVRLASTDSATINGDCGGSMTYSVTANDATYAFTGSVSFNNYCSAGETVGGEVTFSGSINPTSQIMKMTMTFSSLTSSAGQEGFAVSGSLAMTVSLDPNSTAPASLSMAIVMTDLATGKTFYANYGVAVTEGAGYEEVSLSGRLYASDYGYVDIETVVPVHTLDTADYPSSGVLKFTGAAGSWATMTFSDGGNYQIACSDGSAPITGVLQ